jgi:hypothetical protein
MISHILFNLFSRYNIGSFGFRKILAILITLLIFGLLYLTVRFTGMDIPNYTRNLIMLVTVDLAGFLFLMWKRPKEPLKEEKEVNEEKMTAEAVSEKEVEKEAVSTPVKIEPKKSKILEDEIKTNEDESESKITIKKIEEVEEVDDVDAEVDDVKKL